MQKKYILWMMSLIFLTVCPLSIWASAEEGDAAWRGRITVRVNVREAPGEESRIITQIDQGERVMVHRVKNGWCQVFVKGDAFQFMGWVYGKYVAPVTGMEPKRPQTPQSRPSSVSPDKGVGSKKAGSPERAETVIPNPQRHPKAEAQTPPVNQVQERRPRSQAGGGQAAPAESGLMKEREGIKSIPGEIPPRGKVPAAEVAANRPPREAAHAQETRRDSSPGADASRSAALQKGHSAPSQGLNRGVQGGDSSMGEKGKTVVHGTATTPANHAGSGREFRIMAGVVLKLTIVAFSCLAILFAHRAILLVGPQKR
ncbi:MAG: SH3 domain-containing protein [Deltaproteobacteria bacterium]|nr:SH3 domain-containing protein [Deltaproteobacteria bacterium]